MVRFYKTYLGRLLLGLLLLIEVERLEGKTGVITVVQGWQTADSSQQNIVGNAINYYMNGYPDETPSNDDVLQGVFGQLIKKKTDDSDLLDTIVGILRLPYLGGFTSSAVKLLRDAILIPSELSELRKATKSAARCSCGHVFEDAEMATVNRAEGMINLLCTACVRPSYVRCDFCETLVPLVRANIKTGSIECGCQKKAKIAQQTTVYQTPPLQPGIMLDEVAPVLTPAQVRIMRRGASIYNAGRGSSPTPATMADAAVAPTPLLDLDETE